MSSRVSDTELRLQTAQSDLHNLFRNHEQLSDVVKAKADAGALTNYTPVKQFVSVSSALKDELKTKADHRTQCNHSQKLEVFRSMIILCFNCLT